MRLRNKKTGEICELGSIRQAWREEKDGGMGYMLLKSNDNKGIIYNSLAELNEEWEDYAPTEPLIKNEKIRKAVRAWAEANVLCEDIGIHNFATGTRFSIGQYAIEFMGYYICNLVNDKRYTITELCGEEEE